MPLLFNVNLSVLHSQLYPCVPSRPLHFLLSNLPLFTESPPLSISLVLSFAVSQLTKHFFFAFLCFSFPAPNLSSFISIFHSFTVGYIFPYPSLFFFSPLPTLISPLHPYLHLFFLFTVENFCCHQGNRSGDKQTVRIQRQV